MGEGWKHEVLKDWTLESENTVNSLALVTKKKNKGCNLLLIYTFFFSCEMLHSLWLCRCPQHHPPAHAKGQNQTPYTPGCCSPERSLLPGHGGRSSCLRGISYRQLFHAAFPRAGTMESPHRGPIEKTNQILKTTSVFYC